MEPKPASTRLPKGLALGSWLLAALVLRFEPTLLRDDLTDRTMEWLQRSKAIQVEADFLRLRDGGN